MSRRIDKDDFIKRAKEKYGNKYIYDNLEYENYMSPVIVECPEHGNFEVIPKNHLHSSSQCNWCIYGRSTKKYTTDDFIKEAYEVHDGQYDYTNVVYKNCDAPVEIICKHHGSFLQSPYNHLRGSGCIDCWYDSAREINRQSVEDFIKKAHSTHEYKYSYDNVEYINNKTQVVITCPLHGDFKQTPHDHLAGNGCRDCAYADRGWGADGFYGTDKPSNLYVVTMSNPEEDFIKVGLAKNIKDRFFHFNRETNYQVILKCVIKGFPASDLFKIEQDILHRSGFTKYRPNTDFRGKTECLEYKHINDVIDVVMKYGGKRCTKD